MSRVLDRARVPVVRAAIGSVKVDISLDCAAHTGVAAASLCRTLFAKLPELAPAALAVRGALAAWGLNDAYTGGLPSYAGGGHRFSLPLDGSRPPLDERAAPSHAALPPHGFVGVVQGQGAASGGGARLPTSARAVGGLRPGSGRATGRAPVR